MYDTVIIGGGVVGCAVARFLSRFRGSFCLLERENDVCCGTSKANSAIIHAGFDAKAGTLMAKYNVLGSRMMPELARELDIPFRRNGSLVLCMDRADLPRLEALCENGLQNGVEGLEIIDARRLHEMEPNVSRSAVAALWALTGGIVCPFGMTVALGENAIQNGVEFRLGTRVSQVRPGEKGTWLVITERQTLVTRAVVNAAGVYSGVLHNMVSKDKIHITPRRGEYLLLDKSAGETVHSTVFQLPGVLGKGVLVTPTIHGNLLIGPTAQDTEDFEGTNTTAAGLAQVRERAQKGIENIPFRQTITSFAGLRAHEEGHEFILGQPRDAKNFFDCAGIESPGLSAAPAIGLEIANQVAQALKLPEKEDFVPTRQAPIDPRKLTKDQWADLVRREPEYGQIICRCEQISQGEILAAIRSPLGARDLDGVKRRTRAGMGRCQGGFCAPRVMEILARELGVSQKEITKAGGGSGMICGRAKNEV